MKSCACIPLKLLIFGLFFLQSFNVLAQTPTDVRPDRFRDRVQIGGGLGVGFGSGYSDVTIAPSAIYNFNDYFSAGVGLNGTYVRYRNYNVSIAEYRSYLYGGSIIGLFHPIREIQISAELEQLRVNTRLQTHTSGIIRDNFWNTALFVGAGYRAQNVTIGLRYNVLHNPDKTVYADALTPFVRVYF